MNYGVGTGVPLPLGKTHDGVGGRWISIYRTTAEDNWGFGSFNNTTLAHEIGHVMGLGERYHPVRAPEGYLADVSDEGWGGNIMTNHMGNLVRQSQIDEIINYNQRHNKFPKCLCPCPPGE